MKEYDKDKIERRDYELSRKEEMPQKPGYTTPDPANPQAADSREPTAIREPTQSEFSNARDFEFHHDSTSRSRSELTRQRDDQ